VLDGKLESWKAGFMKLTLDLPEDMLRDLRIQAVNEGKTFKALMTELLRSGLATMQSATGDAASDDEQRGSNSSPDSGVP
jgi:plasmid stability protein